MNIQEYISNGIVESYVLGLASTEEKAEFEKLCMEYPELVQARSRFEIALEQQLFTHAVAPVNTVKENVMNAIRQQPANNQTKVITMKKH